MFNLKIFDYFFLMINFFWYNLEFVDVKYIFFILKGIEIVYFRVKDECLVFEKIGYFRLCFNVEGVLW